MESRFPRRSVIRLRRLIRGSIARRREIVASHSECDGGRVMASVYERLIDEGLEHLAVIGAYWARRLCHVDTDDLFLGIDPEKGGSVTCPYELARRAGQPATPSP